MIHDGRLIEQGFELVEGVEFFQDDVDHRHVQIHHNPTAFHSTRQFRVGIEIVVQGGA